MNVIKLQQDILKNKLTKDDYSILRVYEDKVYYTKEAKAVYFIDGSVFMLDFEKLKCGSDKLIPSLLKKFEDNGAAIARPKGMTADGKYLVIEAKEKENFFLKSDFKYFDDEAEFYFKYTNDTVDPNILFVYESGEIVGIICAVMNVKY